MASKGEKYEPEDIMMMEHCISDEVDIDETMKSEMKAEEVSHVEKTEPLGGHVNGDADIITSADSHMTFEVINVKRFFEEISPEHATSDQRPEPPMERFSEHRLQPEPVVLSNIKEERVATPLRAAPVSSFGNGEGPDRPFGVIPGLALRDDPLQASSKQSLVHVGSTRLEVSPPQVYPQTAGRYNLHTGPRTISKQMRLAKSTQGQIIKLVDYMYDHCEFALGIFTGAQGKASHIATWHQLTDMLNSLPGPKKDVAKWQECWKNLKSQTNKKCRAIKMALREGANADNLPVLSPNEEKVRWLLGKVSGPDGTGIGTCGAKENVSVSQNPPTPANEDVTVLQVPDSSGTRASTSSPTICIAEATHDDSIIFEPGTSSDLVESSAVIEKPPQTEMMMMSDAATAAKRSHSSSNATSSPKKKRKRPACMGQKQEAYRADLLKSQLNSEAALTKLTEHTGNMASALTEMNSTLKQFMELMMTYYPPPPPSPPLPPPPSP